MKTRAFFSLIFSAIVLALTACGGDDKTDTAVEAKHQYAVAMTGVV